MSGSADYESLVVRRSAGGLTARLLLCAFSVALLGACASQGRPGDNRRPLLPPTPHATDRERRPNTEILSLDEMLERDEFDLARALLLFSERYYPEFSGLGRHDTDVPAKLARFEAYARELRREVSRAHSPRMRLRALTDFVHFRLGLRFDPTDAVGLNPDNLFFDRVLQTRYGYCVSLSLAYLVFGRAAGLDVAGIRVPGHFAVLYRDQDANGIPYHVIIETTDLGAVRDEIYYFTKYRFSADSVENGVFLKPLSNREIFGTIYNNLGGLTFERGDLPLATERYTRGLALAPNNVELMYNRALVQRRLKQPREALHDLNEALRLDPRFTLALMVRATLFWENGEHDQARGDLALAMRQRPDWPETHMLEGQFLFDSDDLDSARESFRRALEVNPEYRSAHLALAELEQKAGNHAQAMAHRKAAGEE